MSIKLKLQPLIFSGNTIKTYTHGDGDSTGRIDAKIVGHCFPKFLTVSDVRKAEIEQAESINATLQKIYEPVFLYVLFEIVMRDFYNSHGNGD